ncbi:hypothetical protein [Epibacterium ulvae]|uniref:hypothetical protein n=1 Tax=Epibacterium ulvae TaxID=1156985 RepID=UPI002492E4BA|nr:hypothetical protein [Epibacterium ulvae]
MMPGEAQRRVGVLGPACDPFGQVLEDQPARAHDLFLPLISPSPDAAERSISLDEILVLSQNEALAHLPALLQSATPVTLILRRNTLQQDHTQTEAALRMLATALKASPADHIQLCALTPEAAQYCETVTGLPVSAAPALRPVQRPETSLPLDRGQPQATFFLDTHQIRDVRRIKIDALSWGRLRRLARLHATDPNDQDLVDLCAYVSTYGPAVPALPRARRMLAVVPNGVGLGHITRMMALARALQSERETEVVFWCFSRAAEILQAAGYPIVLRQTAAHLRAHPPDWRDFETQEFALLLQTFKPDIVAYDGAMIDPFVFAALRMPGCGTCAFLWVRRGMLSPDADPLFMENEQFCDLILEPGDLAVAVDQGPTRLHQAQTRGFCQTYETQPVSLAVTLPAYSSREARKRMGLRRGTYCLISLGGAFGDWDALETALVAEAKRQKITLIWAQSPLAPPPRSQNTLIRRLFPLSRYLPGIDGVVTAAGYNSFHELMLTYDKPVLFAPTNHIRMDDQVARASFAATQNWADVLQADTPEEITPKIRAFMQAVKSGTRFPQRPKQALEAAALNKRIDQMLQPYMGHAPQEPET